MTRTKEEARAYQQGYATGRKRAVYDFDRELAAEELEAFRRQAALAILQTIMAPGMNWGRTVDGKHVNYRTGTEYATAAFNIADEMTRRTSFTGRSLRASAMSAGTAETRSGSGLQPASAVPKADAQ